MQAFASDIIGQDLMMFTKSLSDFNLLAHSSFSIVQGNILPHKVESFVLYSPEKLPTEIKIFPSLFVVFCPFVWHS